MIDWFKRLIRRLTGKPNQGFFWHVHHGALIEWCHDYYERARYIREEKSEHEHKTRLRLLKPVRGKLPPEVVEARQVCARTRRAFDKARQAHEKAWQTYWKMLRQASHQVEQISDEAEQVREKARRVRYQAGEAYEEAEEAYYKALRNNKKTIEALHAEECPNCPWDGHTIFPEK